MYEKERTIEITAEQAPYAPVEQLGTYKLKRWSWYEKQQALEKATIVIDAEKGIVKPSMPDYNIQMLLICVVEAPFEIDEKAIKGLDEDVGDAIFKEFKTLNSVPKDAKRDF